MANERKRRRKSPTWHLHLTWDEFQRRVGVDIYTICSAFMEEGLLVEREEGDEGHFFGSWRVPSDFMERSRRDMDKTKETREPEEDEPADPQNIEEEEAAAPADQEPRARPSRIWRKKRGGIALLLDENEPADILERRTRVRFLPQKTETSPTSIKKTGLS
ncbi:uncharacterized protein LOC119742744 [Patiria miniata]|uniref:Uncharacterized protein n=1 Tax=Patiria miniata TaxID=46514 RepID=A0A914BG47_PATMI|nr:uncharacterized protein LOC119742744 [Patiria miniata]